MTFIERFSIQDAEGEVINPATVEQQAAQISELQAVVTALGILLSELQQKTEPGDAQNVAANAWPLPTGAATESALQLLLTELQQKTEPSTAQAISLDDLLLKMSLQAMANLNVDMTGRLRVGDVTLASSQTLGTVTTVTTVTNIANWGLCQAAAKSQWESHQHFGLSFRSNLVVS